MQFGIFTVGDVTPDPTTGRTPTEHERIKAMTTIAKHAEDVGLDVFATGEHHNPPFVPSSPDHDARLPRSADREDRPVDVHDADHHQRPGEDRRGLRDAAAPRGRPGGSHDGSRKHGPPSTRGSVRTSAREFRWRSSTTGCCAGCGTRTSWTGRDSSAPRCRASRRPRVRSTASRPSCGTLDPQPGDRRDRGVPR